MPRPPEGFFNPSIHEASTSQEAQEGVESSTLLVTLLSGEWRSSTNRDLSTFNRELAIQLAKHPSVQISVFLPQCSEDDKRIAASHKVQLIEAEKMTGVDPVDWLINIPQDHAIDCIIGHGVHLGRQIPVIQRSHKCKWIQIVHSDPEALAMYKSNADAIPRGEKMQQAQIELCELADQVVAVGPKLADTYRRYLRSSEKHQDVIDLTPSIFTEFKDVKQSTKERRTFCVLVIGSENSEDFNLKGYDLAAEAIAQLKEKSYHLNFVCSPGIRDYEIAKKLLEHGIAPSQLKVHSFDESRKTLAELFCLVDLAIMPSTSECFGLTALEALSAGLPVLVSSNSGLGEALMKVPYGSNWVVDSEDPKHWASRIKDVREKDRDVRLAESNCLRQKYLETYSWQESCDVLVKKMRNLVTALKLRIDVVNMKPAEENRQGKTPVSAIVSGGSQEDEHLEASASSVTSGHTQPESAVPQASTEEVMRSIASRYLEIASPSSMDDLDDFMAYMKKMRVIITGVDIGSLLITVRCDSLHILERFWKEYLSGYLGEMVQKCFVSEELLADFNLAELNLSVAVSEKQYEACKSYFEKDPPRAVFKEGKPSERDLDDLGEKIATKWQELGLHLGICQDVLDEIEAIETEKPYRMLLRWRDTTTSNVLYEDLYHALCHHRVGLPNLAKEFCFVSAEGPSPPKRTKLEDVSAEGPSLAKCTKFEDFPTTRFLELCQKQVREIYKTKSKVKITPWNPDDTVDIDDIYIQLSMLRDGKKPHGTTKEKLEDYTNMFKGYGDSNRPKRILVYGRPGIGKSTFTQKIAVDWARHEKEILKKFDVMLLINLRDVCNSQDFLAVMKTAGLLSADDPVAINTLYEYICDHENQEKVLLVLDGFDEYSAGKSSPVHEIWRGERLRDCCVVLTTQPVKEQVLSKASHAKFEINGFDSEKQVKEFASKFLSDQDVVELVKYLQQQNLWAMVEIPLLLLMLCLVWKELKGQLRSRADLFERFLLTLLQHKDSKVSEKVRKDIGEYRGDFSKLGELAFYALLEGRLYLRSCEWPADVDLEKFIDSGVFHTSKPQSSTPEENVDFLHKSFQEFFAAQFVVDELKRKENKTSTCLSKVNSLDTVKELAEVLKFVCELSSDAACAVLKHLQWIGEKEGLTEYNFTESPDPNDLSDELVLFISICTDCLICCAASDRQALLPLFLECVHGVVILQPEQVPIAAREHVLGSSSGVAPQYVFFDYLDEDTKIMDDDIFSVMCDLNTAVVTCSGESRKVKQYSNLAMMNVFLKTDGEQIFLCLNKIRKDFFNALPTELLTELTSTPVSPPQKSVDDLTKNQDNVVRQVGQHSLSFVGKVTVQFATSEDITVVNNVLSSIPRPKKIKIKNNTTTSALCEAGLISNINFTDCLLGLKLFNIGLTAKCATEIAKSLHQVPNLKKLDLSQNPLYGSVSDLARNIHHVPELTELKLADVQMGEKECVVLASSLNNVNKLQELDIAGNSVGQGIMALVEHLAYLPELVMLNLEATEMGEKEVTAVAQCLPSLSQLKMIYLSDNPLGRGIIELAEHMNCLRGLTEVELTNTKMGEEEAAAIARCLPSLSQLKRLNLSVNPVGHGIVQLTERLKCVPNLTELDLFETDMGREEVSALARALKHVPKLRSLLLSGNPLDRGIRVLIQHLSSVSELRKLHLYGVKMRKKEVNDLGAVRDLIFEYHSFDKERDGYRPCTEAELKAGGWLANGVLITFDDEYKIKCQAESDTVMIHWKT